MHTLWTKWEGMSISLSNYAKLIYKPKLPKCELILRALDLVKIYDTFKLLSQVISEKSLQFPQ